MVPDFGSLDHEAFMREALVEAERALGRGDFPIGAVIVHEGKIVARGSNARVTGDSRIAHAELRTIESCASFLFDHGRECVIYTTMEPCIMCLGVIVMANVRSIVYGMADTITGNRDALERVPYIRRHVDHYLGGVLEARCAALAAKVPECWSERPSGDRSA